MRQKRRLQSLVFRCLLALAGVLGAHLPAHAQVFQSLEVVSGSAGDWLHFQFQIPEGATFFKAELMGGPGDADLYVRPGAEPTETEFNCRPWLEGNDETCDIQAPQAGVWFVGINGWDDFADVTLAVSWAVALPTTDPPPPPLTPEFGSAPTDPVPPVPPTPPGPMQPPAPTSNLAEWQQQMLDRHNALRAQHCAPAQTWDAELAAGAQAWADQCQFEHSSGNWGENLAAGTNQTPTGAVNAWYSEISQYNFAQPGFTSATGHFTQVVWRGSTRLGCGMARCPNIFPSFGGANFFVCRYGPPGNIVSPGLFEANVRPAPANGVCQ